MILYDEIRKQINNPEKLETLFRENNKKDFSKAILEILEQEPENILLKAWKERLFYNPDKAAPAISVFHLVGLCLLASMLAQLYRIDEVIFYQNISFIIFLPIATFFIIKNKIHGKKLLSLIVATLALIYLCNSGTYFNIDEYFNVSRFKDTSNLIILHTPLLLISLLRLIYTQKIDQKGNLKFIAYLGELIIYTAIILFGGIILTVITLNLILLLKYPPVEKIMEIMISCGTASAPVVATYLCSEVIKFRISSIIARIFSPLLLIVLASFLVLLALDPMVVINNRESLLIFNIVLISVFSISVFSIIQNSAHDKITIADKSNLVLVFLTILMNLFLLSGIVVRLNQYGFTPNRLAVLGSNLLIFIHLCLIFKSYIQMIRTNDSSEVHATVSRYLNVYFIWGLIVVLLFPIIFYNH